MMKAMSRYGSVKMQRIKEKKKEISKIRKDPFSRGMIWFFPYYNTLVVVPGVI
mgnify:CR=1 FL=1